MHTFQIIVHNYPRESKVMKLIPVENNSPDGQSDLSVESLSIRLKKDIAYLKRQLDRLLSSDTAKNQVIIDCYRDMIASRQSILADLGDKCSNEELSNCKERLKVIRNSEPQVEPIFESNPKPDLEELHNLEVSVYLENGEGHLVSQAALFELLNALGYDTDVDIKPIISSWRLTHIFKALMPKSEDEIKDMTQKIQLALEQVTLDKARIKSDSIVTDSVVKLLSSIKKEKKAVIRIGTILLVKSCDKNGKSVVAINTLSAMQAAVLDRNTGLLGCPDSILSDLDGLVAKECQDLYQTELSHVRGESAASVNRISSESAIERPNTSLFDAS